MLKPIMECRSIEDALYTAMHLTCAPAIPVSEEELLHLFTLCDAYWYHSGDPKDPHAELTSGWCSNGFFDCLRVLKYNYFSELLAQEHAKKIRVEILRGRSDPPKWVLGSPMAAVTYAHDVAEKIGAMISMFLEKDPANPKKLIWNRMNIPEGEPVLQIEELTTTAYTLNEGERAIRDGNKDPVNFVPYIGILVHRPPELPVDSYGNRRVVALIEKEVWAVPPEECPLCKQGSKRLRPKQNWAELTGKAA